MSKLKEKIMTLTGGNEVLAYSLTIFGSSMISSLMGSALSFFYTDVLKIAAGAVGTIFIIARVWDAVNDPIMGVIVDRTHTKYGKCIPYLKAIPIPLFIVTLLVFLPIQNAGAAFKTVYAGILYILYFATFTAVDIPINGLQPLLFTEQEQRNKAVSISSTLGSAGTILPSGLYFILVSLIGGSENSPIGNFIVASAIVGIGCVCIFISSKKLKEKITIKSDKSFKDAIKPIFSNKPLLFVMLANLFSAPMNMSSNVLVYFCTWNYADTGIPMSLLFPLLQVSSGISWIISILCTPYLLKKFSKKKLYILMCLLGAALNTVMYFAGYESMVVYMVLKFFANFPGGVCATLTTLLISDCVEYAEWKTGERTEGITFSITKLITKTSAALISSLTMFILASVNYDPTAMQKTLDAGGSIAGTYPEVLNMIYILMTLSLSAAFILQMIPMLFYKFEGEEQKNILDELNARRVNTDA